MNPKIFEYAGRLVIVAITTGIAFAIKILKNMKH